MGTTRREPIAGPIRVLFEVGTVAGMSDGQLLDRFLARLGDEEAAEIAFAALVERHGPMVLRACRGRLGDEHDAQDAFQATFLILARKARSIRDRESAASWLLGVARRVASCARRAAAVRRAKERKAAGRKVDYVAEADRSDVVPTVREEVGDLPEKERAPLMLCLLDGLTHEEAAARLGWPVGTVKTRVRRAKDRLRARLARRGLAPSLGAIATALSAHQASAMPAALVRATARAALEFPTGHGALSASVAALVDLGLRSLMMTRWKVATLVLTTFGVFAAGATGLARPGPGPQEKETPAQARPDVKPADPVKPEPVSVAVAVAVAVAGEDSLDQLDLARLDLELLREKSAAIKVQLAQRLRQIDDFEAQLDRARKAENYQDLRNIGTVPASEGFDAAKERMMGGYQASIAQQKEAMKRPRDSYLSMRRQLRRDEQRVKELEAHVAPAGPSGPAEGGRPTDDERDERVESSRLDIELLGMEVSALKRRVTTLMQTCLAAKDQMREFAAPPNPQRFGGGGIRPLKGREFEEVKKEIEVYLDNSRKQLEEARADYLAKSRDLKREQRRLDDLRKPAEAAEAGPAPDPKAPPGVERRLSDVERKLDLILKALEKPGKAE